MKPQLSKWTLDRIAAGKRLTKSDMAYHFPGCSAISIYWDSYKRDEIVKAFNERFGTNVK